MVQFIQETYDVNYSRNNTNQIVKNLRLLIISFSLKSPFIREDWKLIRRKFTN